MNLLLRMCNMYRSTSVYVFYNMRTFTSIMDQVEISPVRDHFKKKNRNGI